MLDYPITLEVTETGVQQTVEGFCCGDRDRKRLRISLLLQGRKIDLSPYCAAAFTATKPDTTEISHPCTIEDGDICYVPAAQTLAAPGTLICRIVVFGSDESVLYAPQFALSVEQEAVGSETVVSADEHLMLPIHVLSALADAGGTLIYHDAFAGKTEIADTFSELPMGSTGQLAYVRNADADHSRGFYRYGTQWEALAADSHLHVNRELLDSLHVENGSLYCGSSPVGGAWIAQTISLLPSGAQDGQLAYIQSTGRLMYRKNGNWYIAVQNHLHQNQTVLDKLSADAEGQLLFDGRSIQSGAGEEDTLVPLNLGTEYASLLLRSDWADVPIYLTDETGFTFGLLTGTDADADYIRVMESRDYETGLPTPFLRVKRGAAVYACFPRPYCGLSQNYAAGWYDAQGNAVSAPSLDGLTFRALDVCTTQYTDLSDLPAKAQLALEAISRIINVSQDAMGLLGERENAVQRFTGTLLPNRRYSFVANRSFALTLPEVSWNTKPCSIQMDLCCSQNVTMTLPREKLLDGGKLPNTRAGYHTLTFTYVPAAGKWSVGSVDRVVPQYWDDIPDEVTSFNDCTWTQIKSIAQNGYLNNYGQWCIRRENNQTPEQVWFEVGDEKTIELSTGETWVLQILDFAHDDLADGSGKAPFTIGLKGLTTSTYMMNPSGSNGGGWESCYFRTRSVEEIMATLPSDLQNVIAPVTKVSVIDSNGTTVDTTDTLFLMSAKEYGDYTPAEGTKYAIYNAQSLNKGDNYWTRTNWTSVYTSRWRKINNDGSNSAYQAVNANSAYKVQPAFCI